MKNIISPEAEQKYKSFDKKSQIIIRVLTISFLLALTCFSIALDFLLSTYIPLMVSILFILIYVVSARIICKKLLKTRETLYKETYGEQKDYIRNGVFKEIWEEYEDNKFERLIGNGKIVFDESYNNCIEIIIKKNRHEFIISIDEQAITCLVDEETDNPIEKSMPIADISDINDFFEAISSFITANS